MKWVPLWLLLLFVWPMVATAQSIDFATAVSTAVPTMLRLRWEPEFSEAVKTPVPISTAEYSKVDFIGAPIEFPPYVPIDELPYCTAEGEIVVLTQEMIGSPPTDVDFAKPARCRARTIEGGEPSPGWMGPAPSLRSRS